jgi:hypothetical protein
VAPVNDVKPLADDEENQPENPAAEDSDDDGSPEDDSP